jgi:transposase
MPKTRRPYSPEFRRQMVDLVRAGRDPAELAREFEPTAQSISHWIAQADRQEGRREEKGGGLTAAERDELTRLRRENKQLRLERDILSRDLRNAARCRWLGWTERRFLYAISPLRSR